MGNPAPEQPKIEMELLDELTVAADLVALKEEVKRGLYDNRDLVLEYCLNHNVDFFTDWTELNYNDPAQTADLQQALTLMGDSGVHLFDQLKAGNEDAKKILEKLVEILNARQSEKKDAESKLSSLSTNVERGLLGATLDHVKERAQNNPLATLLSGVVVMWLGAEMWNSTPFKIGDKPVPIFQYLAKAGFSALALNHFAGPIFNGKSVFENLRDFAGQGPREVDEMIDKAMEHGNSDLDRRAFSTMISMSQVPFKYFLKAYGRDRNKQEIDMEALRKSIPYRYRKNLSNALFSKAIGRGLHKELERMVGTSPSGLQALEERYVTGPAGAWSTLDVLMDRYMKDSSFAVEADRSATVVAPGPGTGGGRPSGTPSATPKGGTKGVEVKLSAPHTNELSGAKGFGALDVKVLESPDQETGGSLLVRGFKIKYTRKVENNGDKITYTLTGVGAGGTDLDIIVGRDSSATEADQLTAFKVLETYSVGKMSEALSKAGLTIASPTELLWNTAGNHWEVKNYLPSDSKGHAVPSPTVPLNVTPGGSVRFGVKDQSRTSFDETLVKEFVKGQLNTEVADKAFYELTAGMNVEIITVPDVSSSPTTSATGEGVVEGSNFTFEWDPSGNQYLIKSFDMTPSFASKKRELVEASADFQSIFRGIRGAGPSLSDKSNWDTTNRFWESLVDFKQAQFLNDYEGSLLSSSTSSTLRDFSDLYRNEVQLPLFELRDWSSQLRGMKKDDAYKKLLHLGHPSKEYNGYLDDFLDSVKSYDLAGLDKENASFKQEFTFDVLGVWYERTREFSDSLTPLSQTEKDYLAQLRSHFDQILSGAQDRRSSDLERIDKVITREEFKQALTQLKALDSYKEWLTHEKRNPSLEAMVPSVIGFASRNGYEFKLDAGSTTKGTIRFTELDPSGNPIVWNIEYKSGSAGVDVTTMEMTPGMIEAQVDYATTHPDFIKPFDDLEHIFDGMEQHMLDDFGGLNFERGFKGAVLQNKWQSLLQYKRGEAAADYRRDLTTIMLDTTLTPAQKAAQWRAVFDGNFGNLYLRDFTMYAEALRQEVTGMATHSPRETFTAQRFDAIYNAVEGLGYDSPDYRYYVDALRSDLGKFDYRAAETLGNKHPYDLMNRLVELYHRYTADMSDLPHAKFTSDHGAYMRYVHRELMRIALNADEHGEGWRAGTFFDRVIGGDEIPGDLAILSFEDFKKRPELLNNVDYTVDPAGLVKQCTDSGMDPLGDPCNPEYPQQLLDRAQVTLTPLYQSEWKDQINAKLTDDMVRSDEFTTIDAEVQVALKNRIIEMMSIRAANDSDRDRQEALIKDDFIKYLKQQVDRATYNSKFLGIRFG